MATYHVNKNTGEYGRCQASVACPFGEQVEHVENAQQARELAEVVLAKKNGVVPSSLSKKDTKAAFKQNSLKAETRPANLLPFSRKDWSDSELLKNISNDDYSSAESNEERVQMQNASKHELLSRMAVSNSSDEGYTNAELVDQLTSKSDKTRLSAMKETQRLLSKEADRRAGMSAREIYDANVKRLEDHVDSDSIDSQGLTDAAQGMSNSHLARYLSEDHGSARTRAARLTAYVELKDRLDSENDCEKPLSNTPSPPGSKNWKPLPDNRVGEYSNGELMNEVEYLANKRPLSDEEKARAMVLRGELLSRANNPGPRMKSGSASDAPGHSGVPARGVGQSTYFEHKVRARHIRPKNIKEWTEAELVEGAREDRRVAGNALLKEAADSRIAAAMEKEAEIQRRKH